MFHLDGGQKKRFLRQVDGFPVEAERHSLAKVGQRLLDGASLAGDIQLRAPGDIPFLFAVHGRGKSDLHRERMNLWVFSHVRPKGRLPSEDVGYR